VGEHRREGLEYVFMAYGEPAVPLRFTLGGHVAPLRPKPHPPRR
jgi:hypothetical protein